MAGSRRSPLADRDRTLGRHGGVLEHQASRDLSGEHFGDGLIDVVDAACLRDDAGATGGMKGISIIGSIVGTRQDLTEVFALHAAGRTSVVAETRSIDDVNEAIAEVLTGQVTARLVFDYSPVSAERPVAVR